MNGLMIFETIDKEEDPEAARKDPREDLEKNIQLGEDKKVKKYLKHEFRKMKHFYRVSKEQVDRYSKFETVKKMDKAAYIVTSTMQYDLRDDTETKKKIAEELS